MYKSNNYLSELQEPQDWIYSSRGQRTTDGADFFCPWWWGSSWGQKKSISWTHAQEIVVW